MEVGIKDFTLYNSTMEKSMNDKLFFADFLPKQSQRYHFIDFGCANGKLLEALSFNDKFFNARFTGYDQSTTMIDFAKSQWQGKSSMVNFESDWNKVISSKAMLETTVLILSSVLHEIYSYCESNEINEFWKRIFNLNADYIVIRDMCWSNDMDRNLPHIRQCINNVPYHWKAFSDFDANQMKQFEDRWGDLSNVKNLLHYFLKYRYIVNWDRELNENYFALSEDELFSRILNFDYNLNYYDRFQLPTIRPLTTHPDLKLDDCTHVKLILKRKANTI